MLKLKHLYFLGFLLVLSFQSGFVLAKTTIDVLSLDNGLHVFRLNTDKGNTSSVVLIDEGETLLIDPNFNNTATLIKATIQQLGGKDISYVTSSHDHLDHIEQYSSFSDSSITIVPKNQSEEVVNMGVKPTITFEQKIGLQIGKQVVELSTLPNAKGHTNGDLLAYFVKQNALYVGDYLFANGYPIIDKHSGDLYGYLDNIDYIVAHFPSDTTIIAGHSTFSPAPLKTFTMDELSNFSTALRESVTFIAEKLKNGKTIESISADGLPSQFERFNSGLKFVSEKRWIENVIAYLNNSK